MFTLSISQILRRVYLLTLPVICVAGVVGNLLALFVFISKTLRRTSCSWYLAARCVSDGGFLLASLLTWGSDVSRTKYFHTDGLCQVIVFLTFIFAFMSVWLTVSVTVENYIRICRPFSWLSVNSFFFFQWLSFVDMLATLVIPSLIIIILMMAITVSLVQTIKRQSRLQQSSSRTTHSNIMTPKQVTGMLFAVSFCFIILNGPSHVIRLIMVIDEFMGKTSNSLSVEQQVQFIYYLSFAVNLIIYLTCGHSFRRQFKETYFVLCPRHQLPTGQSEMTAMSVVKTEEDHRNEDLTELLENGPCTSGSESRT
ncbi:unnamed protein product [Candidula unifasciata]|uniref:G-protein coupled receptors family 1 profile domain-containing protein n=1 Tax=Candidula unifasciata TaxID=100452 RepID=A0A8S4A190_9EUPU|nr:unnamed protein product [Candidula unifasciata]